MSANLTLDSVYTISANVTLIFHSNVNLPPTINGLKIKLARLININLKKVVKKQLS